MVCLMKFAADTPAGNGLVEWGNSIEGFPSALLILFQTILRYDQSFVTAKEIPSNV